MRYSQELGSNLMLAGVRHPWGGGVVQGMLKLQKNNSGVSRQSIVGKKTPKNTDQAFKRGS